LNIIATLGPIFLLLIIGWGLKRARFPGDAFWPLVERLIYFICFPALLVVRLADARFEGEAALNLVWSVVILVFMAAALLLLLQRFWRFKGAVFTSVFQGGIRFNSYVALAVAAGLLPGQGVVLAAIAASVMIPILNLMCVLVFATYQDNKPSPKRVLLNVVQNPLILSCVLGLVLNLGGVSLTPMLTQVLELLAQIALPLGLLAVGAALQLKGLGGAKAPLLLAFIFRLFLMPTIALVAGALVGLPESALQVLLVFAGVPAASSAYILARQLGGDAPLMAAILSAQTLGAMVSLPLVLAIGLQVYPSLLLVLGN